jgi:hypothetical protein
VVLACSLCTDIEASVLDSQRKPNRKIHALPMPCIHPSNHLDSQPKF